MPGPPYTSQSDIRTFFKKIEKVGPPKEVSTDWVEQYGLAESQPQGIVNLLKWLGIIDEDGATDADLWNSLRVPQEKTSTLRRLVEESFSDVFEAVDVEAGDRGLIRGAFIQSYGSGDPGRYVGAFLLLCELAGIGTDESDDGPPGGEAESKPASAGAGSKSSDKSGGPAARSSGAGSISAVTDIGISLNVEIPAEWTEDQIRERIRAVRDAVDED